MGETETGVTYDKLPPLKDLAVSYLMAGAVERTERDKLLQAIRTMIVNYLDSVPSHYPYLHEIVETLDMVLDRGGTRRK